MTTQKKYTNHILDFLQDRPYINIAALERAAEIPTGSIAQAKAVGRNIPETAIFSIVAELTKCGIEDINGYALSYNADTSCLIGRKFRGKYKTTELLRHKTTGEVIEREITSEMEAPEGWEDPLDGEYKNIGFRYYEVYDKVLYTGYLDLLD